MALKNLLVIVDNTKSAAHRIDYAAALADKHDAHITGLYVKTQPNIPAYVMAQMPAEVVEDQRRMVSDMAERAKRLFDERMLAAGRGDRSEWRLAHGDPEVAAEIVVRYADMVVSGQVDTAEANRLGTVKPDDLVLACGRPVLVVPHAFRMGALGERVLVAWNGSRESARAVADALPLLEAARQVTVLAVNPEPELGDEPGADIALHLARHNVNAEAAHIRVDDLDPGEALLNRAADLGADLIVMGAYGRPRLRELVLGGVTRHILHHMTVPVLMSH